MGAVDSHDCGASFGMHPPKPQPTLRVGISGHRPKPGRLPPQSFDFVRKRLNEVFQAVDAALKSIVGTQGIHFGGGPAVRLVSGLAEGADQFAVEKAPDAWTLDAALPFPREEYLKDFDAPLIGDRDAAVAAFNACLMRPQTTVIELPLEGGGKRSSRDDRTIGSPVGASRDQAYARLGGFLLRQIDILIAVWDQGSDEGAGGTGEVVRAAIAAGIPTVWIHSLDDTFTRMIEGFDDDGRPIAPSADCTKGALRDAIKDIVGVPAVPDGEQAISDKQSLATRLADYAAETWPEPSLWIVYDAFRRHVEGKTLRFRIVSDAAEYRTRWAPAPEDEPDAGPLRDRLEQMLLPRYAWADALATAYAHRYRSAYFICYVLATAAVAIALCGIFVHSLFHDEHVVLNAKAALVFFELLAIGRVIQLVRRGRRERWKERWMEYRALAELLVSARFLAYLGEHGRAHRVGGLGLAANDWVLWYLRATIREIGLPSARLDGTYQRAVLGALDKHVVSPQREWHQRNALALHRMYGVLHWIGDSCFKLTVAVLTVFFALYLFQMSWGVLVGHAFAELVASWLLWGANPLTFLAALLPALGAAVAGIRETGDFDKVAERSEKTAASLEKFSEAIRDARQSLTLDDTGDMLLATAQILTEDLAAWQSVYGHKRLELT